MKKLKYIHLFENFSNENWQETFSGAYEGYHLHCPKEKLEEIKKALGLKTEDIKVYEEEMQEDRSQTFLSVKVNVNALPEDKKENWKETIKDILGASKGHFGATVAKAEKKPNFFNRLFF